MIAGRLEKTKILFYDFEGVMTDNCAYVDQNGLESVRISRADGLGVFELKTKGYIQVIISTEKNSVVSQHASKLGIRCIQGLTDKKKVLLDYCAEHAIHPESCAYIGNDINDLEAMQAVDLPICPADAHPKIKSISQVVLKTKGGDGVIRDLLDLITNELNTK
jgi:YrbI family 3-deoxy-D-manno-octulosonate 8-phosphate phosphatase